MKGEDKLANKSQSNFLSGHQNAEMERMALLLDNSLVVLLEKHIGDLIPFLQDLVFKVRWTFQTYLN